MAIASLRNLTENSEIILTILLDEELTGGYYAQISEASTGSESDTGGSTVAETVESALHWAGVSGLILPAELSLQEVRAELSTAAKGADFELAVRLYASF